MPAAFNSSDVMELPGEDAMNLIAAAGSPAIRIRRVSSSPNLPGNRGSWRVDLADGRTIKVRQVASLERAAVLARIAGLTDGLPLVATLARRGIAVLEEWVEGISLDKVELDLSMVEELGSILGTMATAGAGQAALGPPRRHVKSLLAKLEQACDTLLAADLLDGVAAKRLLALAQANAPERLDSGLVHLDFQARNVVLGAQGFTLVDNELLDLGILDLDLARTWCLWPMSAAAQGRFLRGYAKHRSIKEFLLHESFWAIHTLACSCAYRHRNGLGTDEVMVALRRLASGELPRLWSITAQGPTQAPIRLAFLCDYLAIGGQERIALELVRNLDRSRFEPFVYSFRGGALESAFRALGIPVLVGSTRDPLKAEKEWTQLDVEEKEVYRRTLAEALRRDGIDAALVFAWRDAIPALQRAGVRVVIEKLDGPALLGKISDKSGYDRVVAESMTVGLAVTERASEFGLEEERIECVFPGIDTEEFDPHKYTPALVREKLGFSPDDLIVGTIGRLIADKNLKLLVRSFATIDPGILPQTTRLLIVGPDGGVLDDLRALADGLGVADRVTFLPATSHVASVLAALDIFAMTSRREGLPTALLEAMAMGLPIVTTGAGSIPEVMAGNGFLIPGYGPEGIGQRIARLFLNPELRHTMGQRSRAIATRFASRHSIGRYEDMIVACLAQKPIYNGCAGSACPSVPPTASTQRLQVLVICTRFKGTHSDYLAALSKVVDLCVAVTREVEADAVVKGRRWGLVIDELVDHADASTLEATLGELIARFRPDIIHIIDDFHGAETILLRRIIDGLGPAFPRPRIVHECRDPISTRVPCGDARTLELERAALHAADGWIVVTDAMRRYYEQLHGIYLASALVVPHGFAERTVAPPSPKLSARDGRLHMVLVGRAMALDNDSHSYARIIRRLVHQGIVVHSHFHPDPAVDSLDAALATELPDYHPHTEIHHGEGMVLSQAISAYDVMGVFHELGATESNEARALEIGMPTKAVCAWLLGGIPIVCSDRYQGLSEWIEGYGMGFSVADLEQVGEIANRKQDIQRATRACLEHRHLLTHETQAMRLHAYYRMVLASVPAGAAL